MIPTVCRPDEILRLLPDALAGRAVLLPVKDSRDAEPLRPDLPVIEPGAAVIVTTSGSTGTPKGVVLSAAALLASAGATRERLGAAMRWYSPLPQHYVAGLMVLVRSLEAGTEPVLLASDLSDLPPADLAEPRALSIVPTHLHRALDDPETTGRLAAFDAVLLGGAPARPDLLDRARAAGIRVVTTYGMSETSGGCVYDGVPLDGVDVLVDPNDGRISLAGPTLFSGYRLDPGLTAETLVGGRLLTHDRGVWQDGRLHVTGRIDDVVISGGVNVDLAEVQRHLALVDPHPGVVVGVPDQEWGTRIVLVTESGETDLALWRQRLAGAGLARPALPRQVVTVFRLPRTVSGKIDRQALVAAVTRTSTS
ncbi:AMP-binding protein [Tessaracoccus sp. SD287]|uniref:AMP-binding protein n=1 Tax=Tessaracoccus sp. SD287 TaxID=2782008 RepID=UPI001DF7F145|nr:AMP-binding protein [Tessaracoccus sp. SD287]